MAGGAGGAGGTPNGVSGNAGQTEPYGTGQTSLGGAGGDTAKQLLDGATKYGPYGAGGKGGDIFQIVTAPEAGSSGAIILYWGNGNSGQAKLV